MIYFISDYGFFEVLLIKIYTSEIKTIRNGNNIKNINYLDENLVIKYNNEIRTDFYNNTELFFLSKYLQCHGSVVEFLLL